MPVALDNSPFYYKVADGTWHYALLALLPCTVCGIGMRGKLYCHALWMPLPCVMAVTGMRRMHYWYAVLVVAPASIGANRHGVRPKETHATFSALTFLLSNSYVIRI